MNIKSLFVAVLIGMTTGAALMHQLDEVTAATLRGDIARIKSEHKELAAQASAAALSRIMQANTRANLLEESLAETQIHLNRIEREKQHEINHTTTGSTCLNAATVRLLNRDRVESTSEPATVSQAASGSDAKDGAIATDTNVAHWINQAKQQYQLCSARFDALIDWHSQPNKPLKASTEPTTPMTEQ